MIHKKISDFMTGAVLGGVLFTGGGWNLVAKPVAIPATYKVRNERAVMIPVRDGKRLSADLFRPDTDGLFPAIVERTPFNKASGAESQVQYFVSRGYAVVRQDLRGRYGSEGRWRPLRDDGPDGADLLAWIAAQPWSSGKVGTVGTSYAGATQHAIAITNAPALAAMVPVDAMSNTGTPPTLPGFSQHGHGLGAGGQGQLTVFVFDGLATRRSAEHGERKGVP